MKYIPDIARTGGRCRTGLAGIRPLLLLISLPVLFGSLSPAQGQGSKADYERAAALAQRTRNTVFRASVRPHWLSGGAKLWYRVETAPGEHEFVLIDAEQGARRPAFDHDRLAAALGEVLGKSIDSKRLPFRTTRFVDDRDEIRFTAEGKTWRFSIATGELIASSDDQPDSESLPSDRRPRPSRGGGEETSVRFINQTDEDVELFWIDPEGRRRSYGMIRVGEERDQHTYAKHVWLIAGHSGRTLGVFEATAEPASAVIDGRTPPEEEPRRPAPRGRSPDENWQAEIREHNVWLRSRESGQETQLSHDGTEDDPYEARFHWSPDSRRLVAMQVRRGERREVHLIEAAPDGQLQPKLHTIEYAKPGDVLPVPRPRLFEVEERRPIAVSEELFPNAWRIEHVHWWPDSTGFTFLYNQRGHQVLRIVEIDASTGHARALVDEQSPTFIDYAHKEFTRYLDDTREILWMSERDGWNHLYLYDAATGQVKNQITRGEWVVRGVEHVDPEQRQIWFRAGGIRPGQNPYYIHYCRINFDGTGLVILTEGDGTHEVEFSPDRRFLVDTWSRVDHPPVTDLRRANDGSLICELERADWSRLLETGWKRPERFTAMGRDGTTDIYGVIYRPTSFDSQQSYPVIEQIYAGPQGAFVPKRFAPLHGPQSLAELGFIVVQIDGMGTSHRSKAFHDVCWKNLADSGFPDRILWIKAAAAEACPQMDLSRIGIYGGSAGGQSALRALLAHGDFYKAAVTDCGCHDNRLDKVWWNELWMGWPVGSHYAEQSNVTNAHKLQGKLLLTVGALDRNVDPSSTMQVVDALIRADKDFELVVFPGRGHGAGESEYGKRRRQDFFVRHLLGVEPRWEGSAPDGESP